MSTKPLLDRPPALHFILPRRSLYTIEQMERAARVMGQRGAEAQLHAHQELAAHLFQVMYTYFCTHQSALTERELTTRSHKVVQETLELLSCDNFALVKRFAGEGSFLGWVVWVMLGVEREWNPE